MSSLTSENYQKNISDTKSTKLLVSFCNIFPRGLALGLFDFENYNFQYVNLDNIKNLEGITGLAFYNNNFWFLTQEGGISGLCRMDKNFKIISMSNLNETKDAHSLVPFNNGFLITDTARNRLNKIILSEHGNNIQESEFWKYNSDKQDTVHINSIACIDDKIFVSMFGQKPEQGWLSARAGKIYEITENKEICNNLHHPHSLTTIDDYLFCLESGNGNIHRFSKKGKHEIILKLKGYLRGITSDEKYIYISASARRRKSKSRGTPNVLESSEPDYTHSWIYRIDKKTLKFEKKDLTPFGAEIFDLRVLPIEHIITETENPLITRIWKYEDEFSSFESKFQNNPLGALLSIYNNRPDLQQSFPEIQLGDYRNLFRWAVATPTTELGNTFETELIIRNRQFYEQKLQEYETKETTGPIGKLLIIYLNRPDLQSAFPEVSTGDYDKIIGWAAGVLEGKYEDDQVSSTLSKFGSWYKEQSSKLQTTNEINKLNELVSGLNKKIEEQKTAFDELIKSLADEKQRAIGLENTVTDLNRSLADEKQRAIGLENTVTGLNRSLADEKQRAIGLNDQLEGTKDRLESLLGSPGWQFIVKFRNSYNKYFPPSTKRRRNMDSLISNVIKKLNNQNIKSIEKSSYHENIVQNQTIKSSNKEEFDKNNISDEDLLAIYNRRDDLQNKYPEVRQKNDFAGLRGWYHAYGIKEIIRLKADNTDYGEYDKWKNATRNILLSGSKQKITNKHPKITIIVTVHNHANVVIPCIESVLKWTSMPYDLLIVDDASTEQELLQYLEKISKLSSVQVIHNETNLGYLVSVNNAIKSTSSDVLLLNSDTIVTKNWLDKMYSCAYSNDKISTVSPLSNNATLCSVPEFMKPNKIPDGMTIDSFAETVEKVSEYSYPIISTCVGFCMYIKRNVIDKIGLFDEVFSPGYEEENDFCMRAYKAGFVSVLDDSTFIFHIGRSSFQEQTSRLEKDHMKLILKKHPEYLTIVSGFSSENPLQRIQEKIKKAIIKVDRTKFKNVLMVLHRPVYAQNPGGTEDFCRMLYEGIDGFAKYLLYAADNNVIVVEENAPSGRRVLYRFKRGDVIPGNVACNKSEEEFFSSILDELNIGLVHFHHLLYLPLNFFHIVKNKGLDTIISIHDFYYMCPRIYLFEKGEYDGFCNACVDLDRCDRCLKMIGYEKGFQNIWRKECQKMFERADLIITPTKSTLELYKKVYQIDWSKAKIIEHGIKTAELFSNFSSPEPPSKTMKVGFIGAVKTDRKGKDIILDLLRLDKNNNIEWHFFGRDSNLTELIKSRNIKPVGKIVNHDGWDKSENLPSLLHETGIHIIIIPSQECYSIVLSEVWAAHIPVIVPNLVALGDRVKEDTPGWTYPFPSSAEEILALLNKIFMNPKMYAEKTARFKTLQVRPAQDCIREYQGIYNNMLNT